MKMPYLVLVIAACVLIPVGLLGILSFVAKRPATLGLDNGRLQKCPGAPNCVCSQESDAGHAIAPLAFTGSAAGAVSRLRQVLGKLPRTRIITERDNYLHAEATSLLFRFVDDVEFLVDPAGGVIHVRSASRVGHSDLNANRTRVETIRSAFESSAG